MWYIYVMDFSTSAIEEILIDKDVPVDDEDTVLKILDYTGHKEDECSWMITDHKVRMSVYDGVITPVLTDMLTTGHLITKENK